LLAPSKMTSIPEDALSLERASSASEVIFGMGRQSPNPTLMHTGF
jgi:hypothetical protein